MLNIIELGLYSCRKRYISLQSFDCFVDVLFSFGVFDALVSLIELGLYSKRLLTFVMPVRKREAIVDTRNSSTTQKELSLIMKLSSQIREQVLP